MWYKMELSLNISIIRIQRQISMLFSIADCYATDISIYGWLAIGIISP